jgi:MSHA pilin protein MshA
MRSRPGFTLIELLALLIVVSILGAIALPKYFDYTADAKDAADEGAIGGIRAALNLAYVDHRIDNAPAVEWVTTVNDIAGTMERGELPDGIIIVGAQLQDQRGNKYDFTAETASAAASIELDEGGGGGGGGS